MPRIEHNKTHIRECITELVLDTYVGTYVHEGRVLCQWYDLIVGSATEAHASKILRLYTAGKNTDFLKTQWKHPSFTSWLTWNGFAPTANMHYGLHATHVCSAMDEKWNLQCLKLMINKGTKESIGMYHFLILHLTFPTPSRVYIITLWNYEIIVHIQSFITGIKQIKRWVAGKQFER